MSVYAQGGRSGASWAIMSMTPRPDGAGHGKHDHVVFDTDAPARIIFNDHRRFGLMTLVETETLEPTSCSRMSASSRCPAGFNAAYLAKALEARKHRSNRRFLDQRCGGGAGQHLCLRGAVPQPYLAQEAGGKRQLRTIRIPPLVAAIKKVLKDAIAAGGSTLRDHAQATGDPGNFQHHVPGLWPRRHGQPCSEARVARDTVKAHRAGGPFYLLLSQMPEMRIAMSASS